jgi:hypothetical protein
VCSKPCSSCWSLYLLREEFLSAPIHSPPVVCRIGPSICHVALLFIAWPHRHHRPRPPDASPAIQPRIRRHRSFSARTASSLAEPPVLVLWLNQVTLRFCSEPPQTSRADSGCETLPCTGSDRRLRLAFLATIWPALDLAGHWVPRVRPTCLSTPWRPCKA